MPVLHFFHWEEFRAFARQLPGGCELCALRGDAAAVGEQQGQDVVVVAETYRFPSAAVVLLLPDRRTGRLSDQQLCVADVQLRTRFMACGSGTVADAVHLDVKASICLQRFASLRARGDEVLRACGEEKFAVSQQAQQQEEGGSHILQLYAEARRRAKALQAAGARLDNDSADCSGLFAEADDGDY